MKKRVFLTFFAFMGIALAGCDLPFGVNKEEDKQQSGDNNNGNDNQNQGGDNQQGGDQQGNEGQGGEGGGENENFTITLNEDLLIYLKVILSNLSQPQVKKLKLLGQVLIQALRRLMKLV